MNHSTEGHAFTEIVVEIFKLSGLLATEGDRISAPLKLSSSRWKILGALARSGHELTVSQIARNMGQSRQAVQSLVNLLSEQGLVEFTDNPHHKRARFVSLSGAGKDVYAQMEDIQVPWANHLAGGLAIEDLNITLDTLKKLSQLFST